MEDYGVFHKDKMIGKDKRQHKCSTPDCKGIVYREDNKIKCTECAMSVQAKRDTDNHLMTFNEMAKEFNS